MLTSGSPRHLTKESGVEFFGLTLLELAVRFVLGLLIGFCIRMTGGGVLVLPVMTIFLKMNPTLAVGSLIGVHPGSKLSAKMSGKLLQSIVIVLIFIAAVMMVFKAGH
jgi:uncharacterized membrane protein YfcA